MTAANAQASSITLTGTVRDFLPASFGPGIYNGYAGTGHADFESYIGDDRGIVAPLLGADGKPIYAGLAGNPSTHGATAFNQWYNDTPGVNVAFEESITLNDIGGGIYSYSSGSFFIADGKGFNETTCCGHNYEFTYELATLFTYQAGQSFTFTGDDDVFVYINNQLVIDLGGVHGSESASVNLDTLGLTAGQNYGLNVFFAERHTSGSNFRIDTSIASLETAPAAVPEPGSLMLLGSGAAGLVARLRRRRRAA
jgi:fibro-slime domain-containing protein